MQASHAIVCNGVAALAIPGRRRHCPQDVSFWSFTDSGDDDNATLIEAVRSMCQAGLRLTSLELPCRGDARALLEVLAATQPGLTSLGLSECRAVQHSSLRPLSRLPLLQKLSLSHASSFQAGSLRCGLARCSALRQLRLQACTLSSGEVFSLQWLWQLAWLRVHWCSGFSNR